MKIINAFQAIDGEIFASLEDCCAYEDSLKDDKLHDHIKQNIDSEWCDDAGFSVIVYRNVADYIVSNKEFLIDFLQNN